MLFSWDSRASRAHAKETRRCAQGIFHAPCISCGPRSRRGDGPAGPSGGPAAILVIIITAIMVLYILFLPPVERDKLLNGNKASGGSGGISGTGTTGTYATSSLVKEKPGQLSAITKSDVDHEMSSFRIYDTTSAQSIKEIHSLYVKNSIISQEEANMSFAINPATASGIKLAFNVRASSGFLIIHLNGQPIATTQIDPGSPQPIALPQELLHETNMLTFSVSSPGIMFWHVNEYLLEPVTVIGDVTDVSGLYAQQSFSVPASEAQNLDTATLYFYPQCTRGAVGPLDVAVNGRRVFHGVGDCGVLNHVELGVEDIREGKNDVSFEAAYGSYLVDQLRVNLQLKESVHPVYSFDLDRALFSRTTTQDRVCGQADGYCPYGCSELKDPDCCYDTKTFWCSSSTGNINDRCVSYALSAQCGRCPTGYQDRNGRVPDACKNTCGDDKDGVCPANCAPWQDKDCCYNQTKENYWCNDVPSTGVQYKCTPDVGEGQCLDCPSGYRNGNGKSFSCPNVNLDLGYTTDEKLLDRYDVNLSMSFAGNGTKRLDVMINGHTVTVDTNTRSYSRLIDPYVQSGTNSIELVPKRDVDVLSLSVTLRRRS